VLDRIQPSVNAVMGHVTDATGYHQPTVAAPTSSAP
jgi:hypothetical protein